MAGHSHHVELPPLESMTEVHGAEEKLNAAFSKFALVGVILLLIVSAALGLTGYPKPLPITVVHSVSGEEHEGGHSTHENAEGAGEHEKPEDHKEAEAGH
jgi:hypothetical protein